MIVFYFELFFQKVKIKCSLVVKNHRKKIIKLLLSMRSLNPNYDDDLGKQNSTKIVFIGLI